MPAKQLRYLIQNSKNGFKNKLYCLGLKSTLQETTYILMIFLTNKICKIFQTLSL